jgi:hypothetical protein
VINLRELHQRSTDDVRLWAEMKKRTPWTRESLQSIRTVKVAKVTSNEKEELEFVPCAVGRGSYQDVSTYDSIRYQGRFTSVGMR